MRNIKTSDNAVVGIVTAILLVGLIVTVFAILQTVYVPEWMKEIEADHLNQAGAQFSQMKFAIDLQLFGSNDTTNLSITSPLTLGSSKIPFLFSERSSGTFKIYNNLSTFVFQNATTTYTYLLNGIEYQSKNTYFINQLYSYEAGAVIVGQDAGNYISAAPFFSITENTTDQMSFTLVNISSVGGKTAASGYDTASIRTQYAYLDDETVQLVNCTTITISTQYPYAWKSYVNDTLALAGLTYSTDYSLSVSTEPSKLTIVLNTQNQMTITTKMINAQMSPGWIS